MNVQQIIEWFKTSVPGIIILGAIGSILALFLIKLFRLILKRLEAFVGNRFLLPVLKNFYRHKSLAKRYIKSNEQAKLLTYTGWVFGKYWVYSVVFIISLAMTVLFFAVAGLYLSLSAFLLVTFNFLCLILWAKFGMASAGIQEAILGDDLKNEEARFEGMDRKAFTKEVEKLDSTDAEINQPRI